MPHSQRIAEYLLAVEAVKLSIDPPFTWTSGLKSPVYCDNRMLYSHSDARDFIVSALVSRVKSLHIQPDVIAGTSTAAIGWGALVADRLKLPFVYIRSKAKEHGAKKRIEGDLKPEQDVVIIEDLISTGGSSMSSANAVREEGKCRVADIVAIFSYELPASLESANENKIRLHPLSTLSNLIQSAVDMNKITQEQATIIRDFTDDPERWSKSR
ncbi:MAG: orotate phosphoribosyltransferase [Candidatus Peribacteraceae bacterium]|nr:orotate phosphoribosyltransferase [Candidatus Peribacteraceae bacterium]